MKAILKIAIVLVVLGGLAAAAYQPVVRHWEERNRPTWQTADVTRGRIVSVVESTGTVKPVLSVSVGAFVSGPIVDLYADFNDVVEEEEVLARVDPELFAANLDRDNAVLAIREAEVERAQAQLDQAVRDQQRAIALREENPDFIAPKELDALHFNRLSLQAQLKLAKASVAQAQAALENSKTNLEYTYIRSPVDGIVIDRKIDKGQTLASQFQTPELFIIAPDMEKKMHVFASVDEADIGLIQKAREARFPVEFQVDAYPDEVFSGEIEQIRRNSATTENVVTYPVVVAAANPELKLLPGMTASIAFQVAEKADVLRVPNAALRFFPPAAEQVRPKDRVLLYGTTMADEAALEYHGLISERVDARQRRRLRHVWVDDGEFLRAVPVEIGLMDVRYSELVSGDLAEGDLLVTGLQAISNPVE